jgi:SAM-dependent methyltransferase
VKPLNSPNIFDRRLIRANLTRVARTARQTDFLLRHAAEELVGRLEGIRRTFELAADTSAYHGVMAALLKKRFPGTKTVSLSPVMALAVEAPKPCAVATEDALPLRDGSLDLVTSVLSLHLINDLPGALIQIRRALRPDGLFLGAVLGGESLIELRQAFMMAETETLGGVSPRVFPTADVRDIGGLLQRAGLALPVVDSERLTVTYPTPLALIRELKAMGAANPLAARSRKPMRRDTLAKALENYASQFMAMDGKVRATFEILYLCGWAPHESQQKPLKPGTAKARLADALRTTEIAAGDKATFPRRDDRGR